MALKEGARATGLVDLLALFLGSVVLKEGRMDLIDLVALDSGLVAPLGPVVTKAGAGTTDLLALFLGLAVLKEYIYLINLMAVDSRLVVTLVSKED